MCTEMYSFSTIITEYCNHYHWPNAKLYEVHTSMQLINSMCDSEYMHSICVYLIILLTNNDCGIV